MTSGSDARAYSAEAQDGIVRFHIDGENIHGRLVRLGSSVDRVLEGHGYPLVVSRLVAEAVALVSLVGAGLKFDGRLTLQARSDGPVSILVADYFTPGRVRGYAKFDEARLPKDPMPSVQDMLGKGSLAITLDQGPDMERYQGIVELVGSSLAASVVDYLERSEQVESTIRLSTAELVGADGHWRLGALMLQNLPEAGAPFLTEDGERFQRPADSPWARAQIFAQSVEDHELTDPQISHERLLYRLFHEDGVRVEPLQTIEFGCTCSAERVESVLRQYNPDDLSEMLEDGLVRARCEFCGAEYRFTLNELTVP